MRFYYFSATHWDREWYQPRQVYRKRLLTLTRRVLDLLEQQPEYRQLRLRGDWRVHDRVKYDAENERLTQALKNSYRTSVSV